MGCLEGGGQQGLILFELRKKVNYFIGKRPESFTYKCAKSCDDHLLHIIGDMLACRFDVGQITSHCLDR